MASGQPAIPGGPATIRFRTEHISAFADLSHDRNPLHCDNAYVRTSQFGKPILHGVGAVLFGLGYWAHGRAFRLSRLVARFKRPLFLDVEYDLSVVEDGHEVVLRYRKGDAVQVEIEFSWEPAELWPGGLDPARGPFEPLRRAGGISLNETGTIQMLAQEQYEPRPSAWALFATLFGLDATQLPACQTSALLWSSYFVGMKCPGRQALFFDLDLTFNETTCGPSITVNELEVTFDPRFSLVLISGRANGVPTFRLRAFRRPDRVRYETSAIESEIGRSDRYRGMVVLVSGSGKGFGSVLATAFALHGAAVVVNGRTQADIDDVIRDIVRIGGSALAAFGDVSQETACRRIAGSAATHFGRIDVLVNNASPIIDPRGFLEQSTGELVGFVGDALRACEQLTRVMIPLMPAGGLVLNVSTAYLKRPRAQYPHYLAAKAAIEGLTRALAAEFPALRFVIVRPPRMLTDQTNLAFDRESRASPLTITRKLLDQLADLPYGTNFNELDLD